MQSAILQRIRSLANGKKTVMMGDGFEAIIATAEIWLPQLSMINE